MWWGRSWEVFWRRRYIDGWKCADTDGKDGPVQALSRGGEAASRKDSLPSLRLGREERKGCHREAPKHEYFVLLLGRHLPGRRSRAAARCMVWARSDAARPHPDWEGGVRFRCESGADRDCLRREQGCALPRV